jgi:beta-glucosidase
MMKKELLMMTIAAAIGSTAVAQTKVKPCIPSDPVIEQKVEAQLAKMTLDEKIGQMCEITIDAVTDLSSKSNFKLSAARLDSVIGKYKVGSILNVPLSIAQTKEKWAETIKQIQKVSMKAIGIPDIYGVDQIHGTTYTLGGTLFPQPVNQAASFDRNMPYRVSQISAYETKACCIPWVYAPVMDLGRNPVWPRMWESFGEDCYVNAVMGSQAVRGFQGDDPNHIDGYHVGACMKHFMAYGVPVSGQDRTPSSVSERDLREKFFMPFMTAARAGALSLMPNSSLNGGVPFHANKELLTGWLKEGLNWDGMIVTDWADINNLCLRDHIAATKKDAIKIAINAGVDMSMVPYEVSFCDYLKELVNDGDVPMSRIDDAVRRILRLKYRLNLFDKPVWDTKGYTKFASKEFADDALKFAEETEVLLKNNSNILPLKKDAKILLTGPNANTMRCLDGGWSYSWQGDRADECAQQYNTIYEALCNKFGKKNITLQQGVTYNEKGNYYEENTPDIDSAVRAADGADVIIACVGENSYAETPGNTTDLRLSANQRELVKALAKTGKPIVLILNEGRPRIIEDIEPLTKAVVDIMLPGNYGGDALANLLAGDANFCAKLPFTYPHHANGINTYDFKPCESMGQMGGNYNYDAVIDTQWPFGSGISYTTYKYSNLKCDRTTFAAGDELTFTVDVTNTGKVAGKEAVLLFSSDLIASISPDKRRLRYFDKVELQPGETKTVTMKIKANDLAFVGYDNHWRLEKGDFIMTCGDRELAISCMNDRIWETQNIE